MQEKVNLSLWYCLSEKGFSLDELVFKLKELFDRRGFSGLLELILDLTQEQLILEAITTQKRKWCSCANPHYILNGTYPRKIKTSLGKIQQSWRRIKCTHCSHESIPLKEFIGMNKHQYKSNELEQVVIDAVTADSYRRATESINAKGFTRVSHSTAHRWVMESDCDNLDLTEHSKVNSEALQLMPDGTGFKGTPANGKATKGDLKVIIGVDSHGEVLPIGAWAGTSWEDVSSEIKKNVSKFPKDSILVADGERGIANAFVDMVEEQQRCHWHINRDLYHCMWQDGAKVTQTRPLQNAIKNILAIELPKEDFQAVTESEKDDIEKHMEDNEVIIDKLIDYLHSKNYTKAASYLQNAKKAMFGYIRRWLKTGLICPRASSLIERVMREIGRRIKKIAYNWSDKGCAKMARILLKKFTSQNQWDNYWKTKKRLDGNVMMGILKIKHEHRT